MLDKPCFGCPYSPTSIVSPERVKDITDDTQRRDLHFICHKATTGPERLHGDDLLCRGWHDSVHEKSGTGQLVRIMHRLGGLKIVKMTEEEEAEAKRTLLPYKDQP